MIRRSLLLAAVAGLPVQLAAQQVKHARLVARVDSIAHQALEEAKIPGLSIAVARGKETLLARGYGYARLGDSVQATPETVYPIASVTKQFTAAAIMRLAEQGRLKLKDEISRYLPDYPVQGRKVTIQQLLSHTSGIPDNAGADSSGTHRSALDFTPAEFLAVSGERPFDFAPGEKFAYSNSGYYVLGLLIEKIAGQSYGEFVEQVLLAPAGMTSSRYCHADDSGRARGYDVVDGVVAAARPFREGELFAAAGLCSTVLDLIKWQRALKDWKAVRGLSWKQMIEPVELKDGSRASYGFGIALGRLGKHRSIGHGGSVRGFSSQLSFYPDDNVTIVVLANSERALTRRIADRIAAIVLGVIEPKVKDLPLPAAAQERYAGVYDLAGDRLEIYLTGDKLMMRMGPADGIRLLYQGSNEFVTEPDPTTKIFFRMGQGRAKGLIFTAGELTLDAKSVSDEHHSPF
ncbi:MAG: beta-lactamase family protein [Gemmatimonadetes bacterium]|nr:beta-lactamase family protein [Gemmatimonadota bacterium]